MFPINQEVLEIAVQMQDTLHSTMFPINLSCPPTRPINNYLYIPLCFLLIYNYNTVAEGVDYFTFHYVSY